MSQRNEIFARLLKGAINSIAAYEGKTNPAIEDNLGQQIGVSRATIQRWKAGTLPTDDRSVAVLAEAAIQRGYLGREWLQRYLHAARYPFADKLLDQLCPVATVRQRPPHVYHNLPAPSYSQFIMRPQAFAEVVDGLRQRSAVVLIVGLGGNGKTSLAREVATRCLEEGSNVPLFDAVVWVSDKDRPGTTNLSVVLDHIARTLDYPGFTQFEHEEKCYEVEQLLKRQRILVVVDNFETITDGTLLTWLLHLPEPSKALITSREYGREYRRGGWPVELRGMGSDEVLAFMTQRLRVLRLAPIADDQSHIEALLTATGGNPKAIEIALGLVKHQRRSLQVVVDDLYAARGELFEDLFTRAWALLDEAARRVLLIATFFPSSASSTALRFTAAVRGFEFERAIERLTDLALLDDRRYALNSEPRYTLHPLVRAFAMSQLSEQPHFEQEARLNWVKWYCELVSNVGFAWQNLQNLNVLDAERENTFIALQWSFSNEYYREAILIARGIEYYYYVRGFWSKNTSSHLLRIQAARKLNDSIEETDAIAYHVQVLSKQGNIGAAQNYIPILQELSTLAELPATVYFESQHALALFWMAKKDFIKAESKWEEIQELAKAISIRAYIANRRWLATCLHRQERSLEAKVLLQETLEDSIQYNYSRGIVSSQIRLASIEISEGNYEKATELLALRNDQALLLQEGRYIAESQYTFALLQTLRGDFSVARAALHQAIDLFERIGLRSHLADARTALAILDARERTEKTA